MYKAFLINSRQKSTCSNGRNSDTSLNDNGRDRGPLGDRGIGTYSMFYSSLFLHFKIQEILKQSLATLSLQKELTILSLVLHYNLSPNLILQLSIFRHTHINIKWYESGKKKSKEFQLSSLSKEIKFFRSILSLKSSPTINPSPTYLASNFLGSWSLSILSVSFFTLFHKCWKINDSVERVESKEE